MESVVTEFLSFYKDKKVFITGHTGFKGAWLATWLHSLGASVKGYSLSPEEDNSLFSVIETQILIEHVIGDIRDAEKLANEIQIFQPDVIFHLAAQALVRRSYEIPAQTFEVNVVGTANLLNAVRSLPGKCSVVVITTDKVYENLERDYHYKEGDVLGGYDPYSASKAATEIVVSSFRNSFFNLDNYSLHQKGIATARAGNVIGGGDWNKDRIVPDIIRSLQSDGSVNVRNPNAVRPWQLVLEPLNGYLILGMQLYLHAEKFSGAYNFGPHSSDHLPVKDLVSIALECWGSGTWKDNSDPSHVHEAGLLQLDITKAMSELNWLPKLVSKEAIRWTIDWYKQSPADLFSYTLMQIKNYQQK
ncbi:MAG: CDP-glucose 4,6-dehydratase [Bacteroidota bacterium]